MSNSNISNILVFSETRPEKLVDPLKQSEIGIYEMVPEEEEHITFRYLKYLFVGAYYSIQKSPDRIVTNALGPLSFVAAIIGTVTNTPVTVRLGGDFWRVHYQKIEEGIENKDIKKIIIYSIRVLLSKFTCAVADSSLVVSNNVRTKVQENTPISNDKIFEIAVPIDIDRFIINEEIEEFDEVNEDVCENSNILVTVTNLQYFGKMKAIVDILPEVKSILTEVDNSAFIIAGDGKYKSTLETKINKLPNDIASRIYTPGYIHKIPILLSISDVMIYVSYIDGSPNAVLEAQASELPVVANDRFGISDQISDGETGYLIQMDDKGEIVSICTELLSSKENRERIGKNAHHSVKKRNSPAVIGRSIVEALNKIH